MFGVAGDNDIWAKIVQYYSVNFRSYDMRPHSHRAWEIMLVVSGGADISYWDKNKKTVTLHEGDLIILDSFITHRLYISAPCRMVNVELEPVSAKNMFSLKSIDGLSGSLLRERAVVLKDREACLHSVILSLQQHMKKEWAACPTAAEWIIGQLILTISHLYTSKLYPANPYVAQADKYIDMHYDGEITLDEIAEHIGISRAYLQRLYKKTRNMSIVERINALRINKAKFLLVSSSLSIVDIAVDAGFNNRQHFSHVFSRSTGCPPGEFRKKHDAGRASISTLYPHADQQFHPTTLCL